MKTDMPSTASSAWATGNPAVGSSRTNKVAVWSLVVNLLGVPVGSILAIVLGNRALRQIKAANGAETGRGFALAGVIWGWTAAALVVVIVLAVVVVQGAKLTQDKVGQEVANLAFAERGYYQQHGKFTSNLDQLGYSKSDDRVNVRVFTDPTGQYFCAEAYGGTDNRRYDSTGWSDRWQFNAVTWDHEFTPDGKYVHWWPFPWLCHNGWQRQAGIPPDSA